MVDSSLPGGKPTSTSRPAFRDASCPAETLRKSDALEEYCTPATVACNFVLYARHPLRNIVPSPRPSRPCRCAPSLLLIELAVRIRWGMRCRTLHPSLGSWHRVLVLVSLQDGAGSSPGHMCPFGIRETPLRC